MQNVAFCWGWNKTSDSRQTSVEGSEIWLFSSLSFTHRFSIETSNKPTQNQHKADIRGVCWPGSHFKIIFCNLKHDEAWKWNNLLQQLLASLSCAALHPSLFFIYLWSFCQNKTSGKHSLPCLAFLIIINNVNKKSWINRICFLLLDNPFYFYHLIWTKIDIETPLIYLIYTKLFFKWQKTNAKARP